VRSEARWSRAVEPVLERVGEIRVRKMDIMEICLYITRNRRPPCIPTRIKDCESSKA